MKGEREGEEISRREEEAGRKRREAGKEDERKIRWREEGGGCEGKG